MAAFPSAIKALFKKIYLSTKNILVSKVCDLTDSDETNALLYSFPPKNVCLVKYFTEPFLNKQVVSSIYFCEIIWPNYLHVRLQIVSYLHRYPSD